MRTVLDADLSARTTLGLGGTCAAEIVLEDRSELDQIPDLVRRWGLPVFVLGAGSNILALDGRHEVLILRPGFRGDPQIVAEDDRDVYVQVEAATPLPRLLAFCRREELTGLEGLAGIPGSLGGAIAMNAGSFGVCMADCLHSVDLWSEGRLERVQAGDCAFGYRHFQPRLSMAGDFFLVVGARLRLRRGEGVARRIAETLAQKKARQPVSARSAGCIFKNPPQGPSAGILLDQAGFRGRTLGGVAFSGLHANFLVNTGNGTATEACSLVRAARDAVQECTGVLLSMEVKALPCPFL